MWRTMAGDLGVAFGTVHADVTACREVWREEMAQSFQAWKERGLDRIHFI